MFLLKLLSYIFGKNNVLRLLVITVYFLRYAESRLREAELGTNEEFYSLKHSQDLYESWLKLFGDDL